MAAFTIFDEASDVQVDASTSGGTLRVPAEQVEGALGWELKDEGFCEQRGVPYHETTVAGSYREIFSHLHRVSAPAREGTA